MVPSRYRKEDFERICAWQISFRAPPACARTAECGRDSPDSPDSLPTHLGRDLRPGLGPALVASTSQRRAFPTIVPRSGPMKPKQFFIRFFTWWNGQTFGTQLFTAR